MNPFWSIREAGKALRDKKVSSVELTKGYLERLAGLGREHRAVVEITEREALRQAAEADKRLASGERGPLLGIPYGAKDLLATKGIPTRWGSPGHSDQVFDHDATAIARLRGAGAVLVAKLAMIELAGGGNYSKPAASDVGATLCAWDKKRWAGGSSSGSGAATALGCVGFSIGSETSGSIVCPSAFNGCTGLRPTYGRVSRYGAMALCWTLDKIGPICRSADDCALVIEAIAGPDERDPSSLSQPLRLGSRGPRPVIGLLKEDFASNKAPAAEKAYQEALKALRSLGYQTVDVDYPKLPYEAAVEIIVSAEGSSAHERFIRGPRFQDLADASQVAGFTAGLAMPAVDYLWALRLRTEALRANEIWEKCDCIFTPTFYHAAVAADDPFEKTFVGFGGDAGPSNLLGWPGISIPIGFEDGAPLGATVIAPSLREDVCVRVARDFQRMTNFHSLRPPGMQ